MPSGIDSNPLYKAWIEIGAEIYKLKIYKIDTLVCFMCVSLQNIRTIICNCSNLFNKSKTILDFGAGLGLTTILLALNNPDKKIYYYDVPEQTKFFKYLLEQRKDKIKNMYMIENIEELKKYKFDIVISLENLEHFDKPYEHYKNIIKKITKKYFMYTASFSIDAPGHYKEYKIPSLKSGVEIVCTQKQVNRIFSKLIKKDFKQVKRFWNNKPVIMMRKK
jgi:2-polyprenyl-3-methyl-5-hydroxy-6-metoxy-1,4-benzoquinol methylase